MRKKFFHTCLIAVLLMAVDTVLVAGNSRWVGNWSSTTATVRLKEGAPDMGMRMNMSLFSDNYAISDLYIRGKFGTDAISMAFTLHIRICGTWKDENGLKITPDMKRSSVELDDLDVKLTTDEIDGYVLSEYEKKIVEEQGCDEIRSMLKNDYSVSSVLRDGVFDVGYMVKKNNVVLTKKSVKTPFYYVGEDRGFDLIRVIDAPYNMYILGIRQYENESYDVGLYDRELNYCYGRHCYSWLGADDGPIDWKYSNIPTDVQKMVYDFCSHYIDTVLCPGDGSQTDEFCFSDGSKYVGDWVASKPSGQGKMVYPDGTWYEGNWINGEFVLGKGYLKLASGASYVGGIRDGLPSGEGEKTHNDNKYSGTWEKGELAEGHVSLKYSGNTRLECGILNGKLAGECRMTWPGGMFSGTVAPKKPFYGTLTTSSYSFTGEFYVNLIKGKLEPLHLFIELADGSLRIRVDDNNYPVFTGIFSNSKLVGGCFRTRCGYSVSYRWNNASCNKLRINFDNGDVINGVWDDNTGHLVYSSVFEYVWSDGVKGTYVVGEKYRLTKATFQNASGEIIKSSAVKGRTMMTTDGVAYSLKPIPSVHGASLQFNTLRDCTFPEDVSLLFESGKYEVKKGVSERGIVSQNESLRDLLVQEIVSQLVSVQHPSSFLHYTKNGDMFVDADGLIECSRSSKAKVSQVVDRFSALCGDGISWEECLLDREGTVAGKALLLRYEELLAVGSLLDKIKRKNYFSADYETVKDIFDEINSLVSSAEYKSGVSSSRYRFPENYSAILGYVDGVVK